MGVFVLTTAGLDDQVADDGYLEAMRRDPTGLHLDNLWRLVSPLPG